MEAGFSNYATMTPWTMRSLAIVRVNENLQQYGEPLVLDLSMNRADARACLSRALCRSKSLLQEVRTVVTSNAGWLRGVLEAAWCSLGYRPTPMPTRWDDLCSIMRGFGQPIGHLSGTAQEKLDRSLALARKWFPTGPIEGKIHSEFVRRLMQGREEYGQWAAGQGRDYNQEITEELIDAVMYVLAKNVEVQTAKAAY